MHKLIDIPMSSPDDMLREFCEATGMTAGFMQDAAIAHFYAIWKLKQMGIEFGVRHTGDTDYIPFVMGVTYDGGRNLLDEPKPPHFFN